jgi:hypothetical protein
LKAHRQQGGHHCCTDAQPAMTGTGIMLAGEWDCSCTCSRELDKHCTVAAWSCGGVGFSYKGWIKADHTWQCGVACASCTVANCAGEFGNMLTHWLGFGTSETATKQGLAPVVERSMFPVYIARAPASAACQGSGCVLTQTTQHCPSRAFHVSCIHCHQGHINNADGTSFAPLPCRRLCCARPPTRASWTGWGCC